MKRGTITLLVILGIFLILIFSSIGIFNSLNTKDEAVTAQWQQVENQYQRRSDLIPNLVAVVQNYADFEKSTLEAVVNARAKATQVTVDPSKLDAESIRKYDEAQSAVGSSLSRLLVVAEQYPDLKANQNFRDLQAQLEGTENRIATERGRFNETVQGYNSYIRTFPRNLFAGMFGFEKRAYFEAKEGSENAPDVNELFKKK